MFIWGFSFHCKNYQRIFTDNKGIITFKDANDKGEYNPSSKK
jgi:hypothetical protein